MDGLAGHVTGEPEPAGLAACERARPDQRLSIGVLLLAWLGTMAVDFALHGGVLAPLYDWSSPFLVTRLEAFVRIPVAYAGLLVVVAAVAWLLPRLGAATGRDGARLGAAVGGVAAGVFLSALWTISTADAGLLLGWWVAVVAEVGVAGWILGEGQAGRSARSLLGPVLLIVIVGIAAAITLQSLGYAETVPFNPAAGTA